MKGHPVMKFKSLASQACDRRRLAGMVAPSPLPGGMVGHLALSSASSLSPFISVAGKRDTDEAERDLGNFERELGKFYQGPDRVGVRWWHHV